MALTNEQIESWFKDITIKTDKLVQENAQLMNQLRDMRHKKHKTCHNGACSMLIKKKYIDPDTGFCPKCQSKISGEY